MTARHSAAVARYSREIARELGLSDREQDVVHTAALLHDIGKFIFPDSILFADRKLSPEDLEIVRRHPEQGARLVARIDGYGPVAEIILAHHERIDGNGYPNGLVGEQIPLAARIISVADTYDVMTSRDSYRRPVSSREAIEELRRVSDKQLDAERGRDVRRAAREAVGDLPSRRRCRLRARAEPRAARARLRGAARRRGVLDDCSIQRRLARPDTATWLNDNGRLTAPVVRSKYCWSRPTCETSPCPMPLPSAYGAATPGQSISFGLDEREGTGRGRKSIVGHSSRSVDASLKGFVHQPI